MPEGQVRNINVGGRLLIEEDPHPAFGHLLPKGEGSAAILSCHVMAAAAAIHDKPLHDV